LFTEDRNGHYHRGTEATEGSSAIDDSSNSAPEEFYIEVDEKSQTKSGEFEVGQQLSSVYANKTLHCLYFYDEAAGDEQIQPDSRAQRDTFVFNGYFHLALRSQPS
jgi:hypothetical protein